LEADLGGKEGLKIQLIPVGQVDSTQLGFLVSKLEEIFGAKVYFGPTWPLPPEAYNSRRGQYLSALILKRARAFFSLGPDEKALLLTDIDLYAEGLNFVFGEAEINGSWAIISLCRLKESFYGRPERKELYEIRAVKEAVHELGHVFGLRHCLNLECVMYFSNSLSDTDRKGWRFCSRCQVLLTSLAQSR